MAEADVDRSRTELRRTSPRHLVPPAGQVVAVALGGALGAPLRYEIGKWFPVTSGAFPTTTLAINVSGAFILGVTLTLLTERLGPTRYARSLLCTGVLGAFTTFSTFAVEITTLAKDGYVGTAVLYAFASVVLGLMAVLAGVTLTRLGGRAGGHQ